MEKILIVEDDRKIAELERDYLESNGYETVLLEGNAELKPPNREFELLCFLAQNPNIVFSKEKLFERIWGFDYVSDAATVSVHINRLREKIEDDPRNPKIIETVWGVGYRLNLQPDLE